MKVLCYNNRGTCNFSKPVTVTGPLASRNVSAVEVEHENTDELSITTENDERWLEMLTGHIAASFQEGLLKTIFNVDVTTKLAKLVDERHRLSGILKVNVTLIGLRDNLDERSLCLYASDVVVADVVE